MPLDEGSAYRKPIPVPTPESEPYWEAIRRHELQLQRCASCGQFWFPPSEVCPDCLSDTWFWTPLSGRATLFSWIVMYRAYHPGFKNDLPYNVAVVELEEGPRLVSNVVGCSLDELQLGMPLEIVFDDVTPEATLPKFRPR
jgi:uncharacterized OB-fold protein